MKVRLALAVAVAALGVGVAAAEPAVSITPTKATHSCSGSRYTHAVLSWGHKCLATGQYCKASADREYHRYRFHCHKRDSGGRYHLTR
jgi:hypothetical protein